MLSCQDQEEYLNFSRRLYFFQANLLFAWLWFSSAPSLTDSVVDGASSKHNVVFGYGCLSKNRRIGCVIPHCKLQCGITQPILWLFLHISTYAAVKNNFYWDVEPLLLVFCAPYPRLGWFGPTLVHIIIISAMDVAVLSGEYRYVNEVKG